jgi:hypothetical protein
MLFLFSTEPAFSDVSLVDHGFARGCLTSLEGKEGRLLPIAKPSSGITRDAREGGIGGREELPVAGN